MRISQLRIFALTQVVTKDDFQRTAAEALDLEGKVKWKSMPKKKLLLILRRVHEKYIVQNYDPSLALLPHHAPSSPSQLPLSVHGLMSEAMHIPMPPLMQVHLQQNTLLNVDN